MSIKAMSRVFDLECASSTHKLVMLALANFADDDGNNIFPSKSKLARMCSLAERSVIRTCSELVRLGVLIVVESHGSKPTRYYLDTSKYPDGQSPCHTVTLTDSHTYPDGQSPLPCHTVTPTLTDSHPIHHITVNEPSSNRQLIPPPAAPPNGVVENEQTSLSPQGLNTSDYKPTGSSTSKPKAKAKIDAGAGDAAFDEFWAAYPRRPGNDKAAARVRFVKALTVAPKEVIINSAAAYAASVADKQGSDRAFIKMAATWLNKQCWENDYTIDGAEEPAKSDFSNVLTIAQRKALRQKEQEEWAAGSAARMAELEGIGDL